MIDIKRSGRLNVLILLLFLLTWIEFIAITVCRPDKHGLRGAYYNNQTWEGEPEKISIDTDIGEKAKTLKFQKVSVRWSGFIEISETGEYTFSTNSDDGSRLFIDNNLVVDNGGVHGLEKVEGKIHLLKGLHKIKIQYFQTGGLAVLELKWAHTSLAMTPLEAKSLLPPTINTASFWIYQKATILLPFGAVLWGMLLLWISFSTYRDLRNAQKSHLLLSSFPREVVSRTFQRLCIQPFSFAGTQIIRPPVFYWTLVVFYSVIIFLTLSYARTISDFMIERYGEDIFSQITAVTLSLTGIGLFIYFCTRRAGLLSRFFSFIMIIALYGFLLSPDLRESVYTFLQSLRFDPGVLESLDIYPIYAGEKVHFLEYGFLGLLLCKALSYHKIKNKTAYLLVIIIVYIVGMTDEFIQWALPSRVGEYRDIGMNFMSGGLAVLAVLLVIRPQAFRKTFNLASLRPFLYVAAAAVLYTGVFLQVVHGFGSKIFMPDSGTEFVSGFTESELLQSDEKLLQRFEGKLAEDSPKNDLWIFSYEARRHHYLRDKYYEKEMLFRSYCEQEIIKTYFRSYLKKWNLTLFEYDPAEFKVTPDPAAHVFHESPGQELALTKFRQRPMWTVLSIAASLLCLAAACVPVSPTGIARLQPPSPLSRFERIILRPLFGAMLVLVILVILYPAYVSREPGHTNVIILTLDSIQPDYFSAYGYPKPTSPFFDELASQGVLFSNMITATSWTIPSLASMLTGVYPNVHGIDARGKLMDQQIPTLFEALKQGGYVIGDTSYTMTEPSVNSVYKKAVKDISPEAALSEGRSEESYLLSWMEEYKDEPFFGWVHFHTTHLPYRAATPYNKLFLEGINKEVLKDEQIKLVLSQLIIRKGEVDFDKDRHTKVVRALFTQTLRQQDAKVGKVLKKLAELGLRDNTLIIITADHGEELLEHGFVGHASTSWDTTVYDDLINIPLLVYYPKKLPQGKRIDNQVRMIDIMPTILDILGVPFDGKIQGKSFLPLIQGETDFQEIAFSETTPCGYSCPKRLENNRLRAIRTNAWKLISLYDHEPGETNYELYHLKDDPGETDNVIEQYSDIAAQLKQEMQHWMDAPQRFPYQVKKQEGTHYLDADVETRPIILSPKIGAVVSPQTHGKRILVKWIGDENTEYIIEYDVGTGGYHMTGELEVVGPEQWYGPYPDDIWQALPLYNPWRFRILPKAYPQYPSEWITFEMKYK